MNMKSKISIFSVALVICFGLVFFFKVVVQRPNFTFEVSPSKTNLKLDGEKIKSGNVYVKPGKHTVEAFYEGFSTKKITFTNGQKGESLIIILDPSSKQGAELLQNDLKESRLRESLSSKLFDKQSASATDKTPLISNLPFVDQLYRIDYGPSKLHPNDTSASAIYISYYALQGKEQALDWIKFKGYNPEKLEIIYRDASIE